MKTQKEMLSGVRQYCKALEHLLYDVDRFAKNRCTGVHDNWRTLLMNCEVGLSSHIFMKMLSH